MLDLKQKIILIQNNKDIYFNINEDNIYDEEKREILDLPGNNMDCCNLNFKDVDNKLRLGVLGELYAQYILSSFGYEVYPSIVDDHGIDLIAVKGERHLKIQVKTVNARTYVFFQKEKFDKIKGPDYFILYNRVDNKGKVASYIYPSEIWNKPSKDKDWTVGDGQFVYHAYAQKGSKPEYGIYGSDCYFKDSSDKYCISTGDDWTLDSSKFESIINGKI